MKGIVSSAVKIFEVKDIVWFILGMLVPEVIKWIAKKIKRVKYRISIKRTTVEFNNKGVCSLEHGDPFYVNEELKLLKPESVFTMKMPEDIYSEILSFNDMFSHLGENAEHYFNNKSIKDFTENLSKIIPKMNFNELEDMISEIRVKVANDFLERVKKSQPIFNGELYGISRIQPKREGKDEKATVIISSYRSDYYTHRVMAELYYELHKKSIINIPQNTQELNKIYPFLTAIGMNVILIFADGSKIVLVKRSKELFNMTEDQWHVTMNEAISLTDLNVDTGRVSLEQCIKRGLREEMGINTENYEGRKIYYGDIFYLEDLNEVGITAFVRIDELDWNTICKGYHIAKDSVLESVDIREIGFNDKEIGQFLKTEKITKACEYSLEMLLARKIRGDI